MIGQNDLSNKKWISNVKSIYLIQMQMIKGMFAINGNSCINISFDNQN